VPHERGEPPLKQTNRRRMLWIIPLIAIGAIGSAWWKPWGDAGADSPFSATAEVIRRDFSSSVLATGAVKPQVGAEVRVGARISGKVEQLHANIGDFVEKGQVVAELEKADLVALVDQRRAELAISEAKLSAVETLLPQETEKAGAELAQAEATLKLARTEMARQDELREGAMTAQLEWDRAEERLGVAEARLAVTATALRLAGARYSEDLKQARADVVRARAALEYARVHLSYATITAPIEGVIGSVSTQEGETVAAGLNAPTFVTIIDLNRLQVDAYVDEVDIGQVHVGQQAAFTVDTFPAREFKGRVVAIYPNAVIQENVVNYDVVVEIASDYNDLLRPEMTASVTISLESRSDVLAVPTAAVKRERGKNIVWIPTDGGPEPRAIKVGWKDGQWIEIVEGLHEGETVLLGGVLAERTDQ
jgi:multidrug efflux pump subunit AcrA (membrane-fusion protein)